MKYVIFLLVLALGGFMVIKTQRFMDAFGRVAWAEKNFGLYGGSRLFYKMFGVVLIILDAMMITGWLEDIIYSIFSNLGGAR